MGQVFSDPQQDEEIVKKAVEMIDEWIWDDLVVINANTVDKAMREVCLNNKTENLKRIESKLRDVEAEMQRRYRFYLKKLSPEADLTELCKAVEKRLDRYRIILSHIHFEIYMKQRVK